MSKNGNFSNVWLNGLFETGGLNASMRFHVENFVFN